MNKMNDNNNKVKEMMIIIRARKENSILAYGEKSCVSRTECTERTEPRNNVIDIKKNETTENFIK